MEEMLYSDSYCFIECPELVAHILPENVVNVRITVAENNVRLLKID
jgi:tRNA A37 threonylcarbamoyladenosine biosynthesis protein TsaE